MKPTNSKKYSKTQIQEAIQHWKKVLESMDDDYSDINNIAPGKLTDKVIAIIVDTTHSKGVHKIENVKLFQSSQNFISWLEDEYFTKKYSEDYDSEIDSEIYSCRCYNANYPTGKIYTDNLSEIFNDSNWVEVHRIEEDYGEWTSGVYAMKLRNGNTVNKRS